MFNWLGNLFPYSDLHSLNLDWLLSKMKETAAQAAQAIADSASALSRVQDAQTIANNAQTAANNAQTAATNAQTAAQNAQTAANNAAESAENAESYTSQAANVINKFPINTADIKDGAVTVPKMGNIAGVLTTSDNEHGGSVDVTGANANAYVAISNIGNQFATAGFYDFMYNSAGEYFQARVFFHKNGAYDTSAACTIGLFYWQNKNTNGAASYAPLVFVNETSGKVIKGYARIKKVTVSGYAFQMFFDETPDLGSEYTFKVTIYNIGTKFGTHF